MDVGSFEEIAEKFNDRVNRIVWCSVTTIDRKGRPRSRILHPVWEGAIGWIATGRHSHKEKHLSDNPYVSLTYFDQPGGNPMAQQQVYAECKTEWEDDPDEKRRLWDLVKNAPSARGLRPRPLLPDSRQPRVRHAQTHPLAGRDLGAERHDDRPGTPHLAAGRLRESARVGLTQEV